MNQILVKYIHMQKIRIKQNINFQLAKRKYRIKHFKDPKAFIQYPNEKQDVHKNIEEHNIDKRRKIFLDKTLRKIVLDVMFADMINNKKLEIKIQL